MATIKEMYDTGFTKPHYGIEVEIEHVTGYPEQRMQFWNVTEDGSLRNNGKEFVSIPLKPAALSGALEEMQSAIDSFGYKTSFRCGIHVHVNVGHLTPEQLYRVMLVYFAFEGCLFEWTTPDRAQSVFAVPLANTAHPKGIRKYRKQQRDAWLSFVVGQEEGQAKYHALNLIPIRTHGTIEFRHMAGTEDMQDVSNWIAIIDRIFDLATEHNIEQLKRLNYTSEYSQWIGRIFGDDVAENADYIAALRRGIRLLKQVD